MLTALAPHLPEPLRMTVLQEALQAARAIRSGNEWARAEVMVGLAPHLPESLQMTVLQEAWEVARAISDENSRAAMLTALAPHLPEPLQMMVLQEALQAARAIRDEDSRARALAALASHLPESLLQEALQAVRAIKSESTRARALAELAPHMKQLPVSRIYSLWSETLSTLVTRTRSNLLSDIQALTPSSRHWARRRHWSQRRWPSSRWGNGFRNSAIPTSISGNLRFLRRLLTQIEGIDRRNALRMIVIAHHNSSLGRFESEE